MKRTWDIASLFHGHALKIGKKNPPDMIEEQTKELLKLCHWQREAHPGLQRVGVHADGPRRRRTARAQIAGGARAELPRDAVLPAKGVDGGLGAQGRGDALGGGPGERTRGGGVVVVGVGVGVADEDDGGRGGGSHRAALLHLVPLVASASTTTVSLPGRRRSR